VPAQTLRIGHLTALDWKVGLGVASSHCQALKSPFVRLHATVTEPTGQTKVLPMELSIGEFKVYSVMSTVSVL